MKIQFPMMKERQLDRGDAAALVIRDCVLDIGYSNETGFQYPITNKEFPMTKERPMNRGNAGAAALVIRTKQDFNIQQPTRNFQ